MLVYTKKEPCIAPATDRCSESDDDKLQSASERTLVAVGGDDHVANHWIGLDLSASHDSVALAVHLHAAVLPQLPWHTWCKREQDRTVRKRHLQS